MQLCPHCRYENLEGVIYCQRCGVALVPVPLSTRQLSQGPERGGTDTLGIEDVVILHIETNDSPVMVQIHNEIVLGRVSEHAEGTTFINLSPYGADEMGVSRKHARLLRDDRSVYLMDLNSTNGTRLNGEALPAGVEKRLRDGDEVTVGRLKIYVYFKT